MQQPLPLAEALIEAIKAVRDMFSAASFQPTIMPEGTTAEELWEEILKLREELAAIKRLKRGVKPKVEDAVRLILEDERFIEIPISLIADIVQKVFTSYKISCNCSEKSVRWYMSQRNLEWDIKKRRMPKVTSNELDTTSKEGGEQT